VAADGYEGLGRFADVDSTGEEAMFVFFLARIEELADVVVARQHRFYVLLANGDGELVADVGCGLGTAVRELAARGVRAIGFDSSAAMIAEARRPPTASGSSTRADAADLPLEDGVLGGYRAERVYQHLADPAAALKEARRVLAPGGRIVLVDQDWDGLVIDGEPKQITRAIAAMTHFVAVARRRSPS
jgi:ubiquinone/menaquinone biosynthesis C-methylase UbiE